VLELKHWRDSPRFDVVDKVLLAFTEKLALEPWSMGEADLEELRSVGFTEAQALNIVLLNGYRNYITRIADGTGIVLDDVLQGDETIVTAYSYECESCASQLSPPAERIRRRETAEAGSQPWIRTPPLGESSEDVRQTVAAWRERLGFVPNFLPALGLNPAALVAVAAMAEAVLFATGELEDRRRELVAAAVAAVNRCRYLEVACGPVRAPQGEEEEALVAFAEMLSVNQLQVTRDQLDALRAWDYDDHDLLDVIVEIAALNGITRIVEGLGVPEDRSWRGGRR